MKIQVVYDNQGRLMDLGFLYSNNYIFFEIQSLYNEKDIKKYYKFYVGERIYNWLDLELSLPYLFLENI